MQSVGWAGRPEEAGAEQQQLSGEMAAPMMKHSPAGRPMGRLATAAVQAQRVAVLRQRRSVADLTALSEAGAVPRNGWLTHAQAHNCERRSVGTQSDTGRTAKQWRTGETLEAQHLDGHFWRSGAGTIAERTRKGAYSDRSGNGSRDGLRRHRVGSVHEHGGYAQTAAIAEQQSADEQHVEATAARRRRRQRQQRSQPLQMEKRQTRRERQQTQARMVGRRRQERYRPQAEQGPQVQARQEKQQQMKTKQLLKKTQTDPEKKKEVERQPTDLMMEKRRLRWLVMRKTKPDSMRQQWKTRRQRR